MLSLARLFLLALVCGQAFAQSPRTGQIALPQWPAEGVELRVAHVVNLRLPRMSDAQLHTLLASMAQAVQEHWGTKITFSPIKEIAIEEVFAGIPPRFAHIAEQERFDTQSWWAWLRRGGLERAYSAGLAQAGEPLAEMALFMQKNGVKLDSTNFETFGKSLAAVHLERFKRWQGMKALDGKSVIDKSPHHEYSYWNVVGYGHLPYELVLTNQIMASVERAQPSVHSAIRGGYTNGLTTYSGASKYSTVSIWSTAAFSENTAAWLDWRQGESYAPEEAAQLAGQSGAHELGHQLFHFLHPFGQPACLMYPTPMFSYRFWSKQLSAKDCPVNSSAAMTPGAYKFVYLTP